MTHIEQQNHDESPESRITRLEAQLEERRQEIDAMHRRHEIDRLLRDAGAIDPDTARLVIESQAQDAGESESIGLAEIVASLRVSKPFLFRPGEPSEEEPLRRSNQGPRAASSSPRVERSPRSQLSAAAAEAHLSQKKADLMRYLRLRRRFYQRE